MSRATEAAASAATIATTAQELLGPLSGATKPKYTPAGARFGGSAQLGAARLLRAPHCAPRGASMRARLPSTLFQSGPAQAPGRWEAVRGVLLRRHAAAGLAHSQAASEQGVVQACVDAPVPARRGEQGHGAPAYRRRRLAIAGSAGHRAWLPWRRGPCQSVLIHRDLLAGAGATGAAWAWPWASASPLPMASQFPARSERLPRGKPAAACPACVQPGPRSQRPGAALSCLAASALLAVGPGRWPQASQGRVARRVPREGSRPRSLTLSRGFQSPGPAGRGAAPCPGALAADPAPRERIGLLMSAARSEGPGGGRQPARRCPGRQQRPR